jgi:hypothetical protein
MDEIKGKGIDKPYEKSRFVIQNYDNNGKFMMLTQNFIIQRSSQRILLAIAPTIILLEFILWLRDVIQAYTQSEDLLQRTILAELPKQLKNAYPEGTIMVIIKPLYGIAEAGAH